MSASLSNIVDVSVQVSSTSAITSDFTLGLIVGKTKQPAQASLTVYDVETYASSMAADGYTSSDPEYISVQRYFGQNPRASKVAVGQMAYTSGEYQTPANAFAAFREINNLFYGVALADSYTETMANIIAWGNVVEASAYPAVFFFDYNDASSDWQNITGLNLSRTFGFATSTNQKLSAAALGLISGLNSMDVNSAYTAAYKTLAGVTADDYSNTQINDFEQDNINVYAKFGRTYSFTYPFVSIDGTHMDEIFLVDIAKFLIQENVVNGLVSQRKVPQTESGLATIVGYISRACNEIANMGFIAGGIWRGEQVASLKNGDAVQNGYYIASMPIASQSAADRAARRTPPIYVALLSSGAIEHVIIRVFVGL